MSEGSLTTPESENWQIPLMPLFHEQGFSSSIREVSRNNPVVISEMTANFKKKKIFSVRVVTKALLARIRVVISPQLDLYYTHNSDVPSCSYC